MNLREVLGIDLPIIQAPMAGVQGSALAIAVSNAGGLGSFPCAMLAPDGLRKELAAIKARTARLWLGQNASGCREIPAANLTRELGAGLQRATAG